ncbi:MAG: deoxyribodipyrimidine photo-lyase [Geothrix sp.]|uniref:cryptochrome/photolyase family protein n=1 Tax=Geothrix sp. TaxID=1962974 RepID=UPI00180B64F0|nr:deoxyribodipyrimidine photo-lyase [Geothrix sp.]NWJ39867.1 deoxyribodipyrimidine photo-lyase [Geothrix sp.]WIL22120.1 MAG: DNA photolyase family protein [Geothrix sp.]
MRSIVWFRGKDLRLAEHAPLTGAAAAGEVIPLFVLDPFFFAPERARELPHRMQFLLDSLRALEADLAHLGSRLVVVSGRSGEVLPRLAAQWKVDQVLVHRWVEPFGRERDRRIAETLDRERIAFRLFEGETLLPPGSVRNGQGAMFRVFTPFARAAGARLDLDRALPAPRSLPPLPEGLAIETAPIPTLADLGLPLKPNLQTGGEKAAWARLKAFVSGPIADYGTDRDRMDRPGTSRLSADLKFGTLSARAVWQAAAAAGAGESGRRFLNELLWREFSHHLLWEWPELLKAPFRADFTGFPWREDEADWRAWSEGRTGYPVVDAAARQLLAEGFVHNRARMVAASFLTKHLLLDYRLGEAHYLKWLTDGDWAQNSAGWQWSAGCGCDAQPWFRIFNPVAQGLKFDPEGAYVKRWVPELGGCPVAFIHEPWKLPRGQRAHLDYPEPIVDHALARERFLATAKGHLGRIKE